MITEQEHKAIDQHYAEREFSLPTKQRIEELEADNRLLQTSMAIFVEQAKDRVLHLEAKIKKAREELEMAKKSMGGLARISFQKWIDAALKALGE